MSLIPLSTKTTSTASAAAKHRMGSFASLVACSLIVGAPSLGSAEESSLATAKNNAAADTVGDNTFDILARTRAAERLAAKRIAEKATQTVDSIALSQYVAIGESLRDLDDKSTRVSDVVAMRIDAQLTTAMENFRVNAFAVARSNPKTTYQVANQR